jgi:hypothetical protein
MKKKLFILAVVGLMVCLIGFVAIAGAWWDDHDKYKEGKSKHGHLYFCQKENLQCDIGWGSPIDPPCAPLNDQYLDCSKRGAWGKMQYKLSDPIFKFEFEGHGLKTLEPDRSYTLIYYPDNGSGSGLIYLGSDVADKHGNVHIAGSLDTGDLPAPYDMNYYTNPPGAKIWLVPSSDICFRSQVNFSAPYMKAWNPDKYLFGDELITFDSPENRDCQ